MEIVAALIANMNLAPDVDVFQSALPLKLIKSVIN